jgi:hypothetical protein
MNDVDKLTLELFTSKNNYRRYLAKTDPETFQKQERLQEKICEHKAEILSRIEYMLENPFSSSTSSVPSGPSTSSVPSGELTEIFERFMSVLLQEIESSKLREMESELDSPFLVEEFDDYSGKNGEHEEEEVMFPVTKMSSSDSSDLEKKSFWSKDRVIKRETYSEAILSHYPTNSEIRKRYVGKRMIP